MKGSGGIETSARWTSTATEAEGSWIRDRRDDLNARGLFNHLLLPLASFMSFMTSCPSCPAFQKPSLGRDRVPWPRAMAYGRVEWQMRLRVRPAFQKPELEEHEVMKGM